MDSSKIFNKTISLNDGNKIPQMGLGTHTLISEKIVNDCLTTALESGYKHFDTAVMYVNEGTLGTAFKKLKVNRSDIFITTKILPEDLTYKRTINSVNESLEKMQTNYFDLILLHWPGAKSVKDRVESFQALIEMKKKGYIKSIGVSNFMPRHLQTLFDGCSEKPAVNQIEIHPLYFEKNTIDTIKFCEKNKIVVEAYSPLALGSTKLLGNKVLTEIGEKYGKTTAQVALRWGIENNLVMIPRSKSPGHIKENIEIGDFQLTKEEIDKISALNQDYKTDWDPTYVS